MWFLDYLREINAMCQSPLESLISHCTMVIIGLLCSKAVGKWRILSIIQTAVQKVRDSSRLGVLH